MIRALVVSAVCLAAAVCCDCGGGGESGMTSPSPAPTVAPANTCGALSGTAIVNGTECTTDGSAVVLVNLRGSDGLPSGSCSGTIISPRAVLTAAHCLAGGVGSVRIYLGSGPEIVAQSFAAFPGYNENDPTNFDAGVVRLAQDIGRPAIPLLLSRDARIGETAVIGGWGLAQNQIGATLRSGSTVVASVGPNVIQTQFSANASAVCSGDSGGPLLLSEGGIWAVAGITSAVTTTACSFGTNYFANVRNSSISSFILQQAPEAARR